MTRSWPCAASGIRDEESAGARDETAKGRVVDLRDRGERRDALDPQELVLVDVADAGQRPLVEQRLGDRESRPRWIAQPSDRFVGVELGREQVRPELSERRVERLGALFEELDDRRIEADGDRARDLDRRAAPSPPADASARPGR